MSQMYDTKTESYFGHARADIVELVRKYKPTSVLEIGAGTGATLAELKRSQVVQVAVGIEPHARLAACNTDLVDEFYTCSVEEAGVQLGSRQFDCIILADVLEHLVDPWSALMQLSRLLSPTGVVVASIPNVGHYSVVFDLVLKQRFRYVQEGLLDRTHLRFFCPDDMLEMFRSTGYAIESISSNIEQESRSKKRFVSWLSRGRLDPLLAFRYYIVATRVREG